MNSALKLFKEGIFKDRKYKDLARGIMIMVITILGDLKMIYSRVMAF